MAKKAISFADKLKKSKEGGGQEMVKYVKTYKGEKGAWRFRTKMVELNDETRKEIYG